MTVAPRYAAYADVADTGVYAPVQLPAGYVEEPAPSASSVDNGSHEHPLEVLASTSDMHVSGTLSNTAAATANASCSLGPQHQLQQQARHVHYYMCHINGVDRVFVDHPLYQASDTDDRSAPRIYTYCHADGHWHDLAACHSVLCQAALAAPLLLWPTANTHSDDERAMVNELRNGFNPSQQTQWLQQQLQHPQQIVNGIVKPVLSGLAGDNPVSRTQTTRLQPHTIGSANEPEGGDSNSIVFVGNDWPSGVLPVWLECYRHSAQQQQQQVQGGGGGPMDWDPVVEQLWADDELDDDMAHQQAAAVVETEQQWQSLPSSLDVQQAAHHDNSNAVQPVSSPQLQQQQQQPCHHQQKQQKPHQAHQLHVQGDNSVACQVQDHDSSSSSMTSDHYQQPTALLDAQAQLEALLQSEQRLVQREQFLLRQEQLLTETVGQLEGVLGDPGGDADGMSDMQVWGAKSDLQLGHGSSGNMLKSSKPSDTLNGQLQHNGPQQQALARAAIVYDQQHLPENMQNDEQLANDTHHNDPYQHEWHSNTQQLQRFQAFVGRQLSHAPVAFAIHNFEYQGVFQGEQALTRLGLPVDLVKLFMAPAVLLAQRALGAAGHAVRSLLGHLAGVVQGVGSGAAAQHMKHQVDVPGTTHGADVSNTSNSEQHSTVPDVQLSDVSLGVNAVNGHSSMQTEYSNSTQLQPVPCAHHPVEQPDVNWMRASIAGSDLLVTVSPTYAQELLTDPHLQPDMQQCMAHKQLQAVLNGLDTQLWDPSIDCLLPPSVRYTAVDVGRGKAAAKALLQKRLGLQADDSVPLFAFVGRLVSQKGADIVLAALPQLLCDTKIERTPAEQHQQQQQQRRTAQQQQQLDIAQGQQQQGGQQGKQDVDAAAGAACSIKEPSSALTPLPATSDHCQDNHVELQAVSPKYSGTTHAAIVQQDTCESTAADTASCGDSVQQPASSPVDELSAEGTRRMQVVLLGCGQKWIEKAVRQMEHQYPGQAVGVVGYNEPLSHLLIAAADYLLIPSRFEPCGLVAMSALRYGALPIAAATGGLKDIVNEKVGYLMPPPGAEDNTFQFRMAVNGLVAVMQQAQADFIAGKHVTMQQAAMSIDVSWDGPAQKWEALLYQLVSQKQAGGQQQPTLQVVA
eukprot:jgi/Chrzof1/3991/Cz13g16100.t1